MMKKTRIEILEFKALAKVLGLQYDTLKSYVSRKTKNNEPLEFGENGRYKLFGEPNKKWFAFDSAKYDLTVLTAEDLESEP